jgi:hypothetical protein
MATSLNMIRRVEGLDRDRAYLRFASVVCDAAHMPDEGAASVGPPRFSIGSLRGSSTPLLSPRRGSGVGGIIETDGSEMLDLE